ncbi:MAG: hypothetical protein RIQ60_253 [Pseudomonadota bacterium]|jgi:diguanylate cyclase (GGDEF)-like protein
MRITELTLLEQVRITEADLAQRKALLGLTSADEAELAACQPIVEALLPALVAEFYEWLTQMPDQAMLIGDADTLQRLHTALQRHLLELFSGRVDLDYVKQRLRLGGIHRRVGLEPRHYLAGEHKLMSLLRSALSAAPLEPTRLQAVLLALGRLQVLDATLFFESYVRSLGNEFGVALRRGEAYAHELEQALHERERQVADLARVDALTGLINRRHLSDALSQALSAAQRRLEPISLAVFDIDHFKQVNDLLGHEQGDAILRGVASALCDVSRSADSCFRYGGDEFCIILPDCGEDDALNLYCKRVQGHLAGLMPSISLTVGICSTGPQSYLGAEEMIHRADAAMYQSKYQVPDIEPDSAFIPDDGAVDLRQLMHRGPAQR